MSRLAARLAVALAIGVVTMTGFEALRVRHSVALRVAIPLADEPPVLATTVPHMDPDNRAVAEPTFSPPPKRGSPAMAHIHGRVVGGGSLQDDLTITIEDSRQTYEPEVHDDGTFEIDLPVGSYALEASAGKDVAFAEASDLIADEDREVVLRLLPGASLSGRIEGCDGPCAGVTIRVEASASGREVATTDSDDNGEFVLDGLLPGRPRDLHFEMMEKRPLTLHEIAAPRQGLVVTLEPTRSLAGGFGLAPGQKCPLHAVALHVPGADGTVVHSRFDRGCRFRFDDLPEVSSVRVTTEGEGLSFDVEVALPGHGDPPFLCLRPTCYDPEREPKAKLVVTLPGAGEGSVYAVLRYANGDTSGAGCSIAQAQCTFDDLQTGGGVAVTVHVEGCALRTFTVDLQSGANYLGFPCERIRFIDGVVRGKVPGATATARCSSDYPEQPIGRLFRLQCPARLAAIEYRLSEEHPWRIASIASEDGEGNDKGFVDIPAD